MESDAHVEYVIQTAEGRTLRASSSPPRRGALPVWTELSCHTCPGCPLDPAANTHCPAAIAIVDIADAAAQLRSIDRVHTEVRSATRSVHKDTDAQQAVSALVGLRLSRSACPRLAPLARLGAYHLPFCSPEETLWRVASALALEAMLSGATPEVWHAELGELYRFLAELNRAFAKRLRLHFTGDASVNAFVALFSLTLVVGDELEQGLDQLVRGFITASSAPEG
jgi:hypothetical protein